MVKLYLKLSVAGFQIIKKIKMCSLYVLLEENTLMQIRKVSQQQILN